MKTRRTTADTSFGGLPPALVGELLGQSVEAAKTLAAPLRDLDARRGDYRSLLKGKGLVGAVPAEAAGLPDACGFSWRDARGIVSGGEFRLAAAFAAEGLPPAGGKVRWDEVRHQVVCLAETRTNPSSPVPGAVAACLAADLAAGAPHDLLVADGSWVEPFARVMGALKSAMDEKDTAAGREFIRRLKPALAALGKLWGELSPRLVGMPEGTEKRELADAAGLPGDLDPAMLLSAVLDPGEYAGPVPAALPELDDIERMPIREEGFAAARDRMVAAARATSVVYFRPHAWTPALRIELATAVADDPTALARVLAGIAAQCATPGTTRPYPADRAHTLADALDLSIPALRRAIVSRMTTAEGDALGTAFPLPVP